MFQTARGLPAISVEPHTSAQAWKLIEQDYALRLSLVAHEWAGEHLKAWNAVFAEGRKRGNAAYYGPALVEMEIADVEKRAQWAYESCCEIWGIQGRTPCRPFFRAIFDFCLQAMFSTREGCFKHRLELHQKRTSLRIPQGLPTIMRALKQEMGRLRAKWNTKLEIATRDAEHQERLSLEREAQKAMAELSTGSSSMDGLYRAFEDSRYETFKWLFSGAPQTDATEGKNWFPAQVGKPLSVFTWKELEIRFQEIQAKALPRQIVYAVVTRTEWNSGAVGEEWTVGGDLALQKEFEYLSSIAAQKLGYPPSELACRDWLGRVREWMQETGLDKDQNFAWRPTGYVNDAGMVGITQSLLSEKIAELSAKFCVKLMADGTPESSVNHFPEQPKVAERRSKLRGATRSTPKTKRRRRRTAVIFGAIQSGLAGKNYCAVLDDRRLPLPEQWRDEGCPVTYAQAYEDPRWRKRIQDEKSRYREQYEKTPAREREAIIEGANDTRQTRH